MIRKGGKGVFVPGGRGRNFGGYAGKRGGEKIKKKRKTPLPSVFDYSERWRTLGKGGKNLSGQETGLPFKMMVRGLGQGGKKKKWIRPRARGERVARKKRNQRKGESKFILSKKRGMIPAEGTRIVPGACLSRTGGVKR